MEQSEVVRAGKELMAEIRRVSIERELIVARAERRIAAITGKAEAEAAPHDAELVRLDGEMLALIGNHPEAFEKPRVVKTADGCFGLRTSTRVEITDEDKALDAIFDKGYDDCIKTTRTFVKDRLRARLEDGERIAGVRLEQGETASYKIEPVLTTVERMLDQEAAG